MLAASIDLAVTVGVVLSCYFAFGAITFVARPQAFRWPDLGLLGLGGIWLALLVAYLTFGWTTSGRTIGTQVMGLRIVDQGGDLLPGGRALVRALLCSALPISLLWCAIDRRRQAMHDLVVRSRVVYDWRPHELPDRRYPDPLIGVQSPD